MAASRLSMSMKASGAPLTGGSWTAAASVPNSAPIYAGRLCAGRRRHQFQCCERRHRTLRSVPGWSIRAPHRRPAYISAALAYGWQDITTDRTVTIAGVDQLRAKFNANAFSGRVEGGYRFVAPWMGITPYAAGQFTTFDLPAYAEQVMSGANTFALAYGAKSVTATRSELGLRSDKSFVVGDAILTLRGRAAWAHDYNIDRAASATFQTLPGASFVINGAVQAHDAALTTASAEMKWLNGFSLAATFEGEFSDVTRSYAGKGVARYAW
jgi:outer membrane autotransporter protein